MRRVSLFAASALIALAATAVRAQDSNHVSVTFDDRGLVFAAPGRATEVAMRFYIQPLITLQANDTGSGGRPRHVGMQIRRARFGFTGTTIDPRLHFNFQLAFSRQDLDLETLGIANIVADANIVWNWTPNLFTMVGQGKIYGLRQQINPAGELEFPDRSIVYSTFAPDRDAGVMSGYTHTLGKGPLMVRGSITEGEGRNSAIGDDGLAYGARVDWQPLGAFRATGAFSEADLQHEPSARLAVGAGRIEDKKAVRVSGFSGALLYAPRDIGTTYVDATFKRRGLAIEAEFAKRETRDPVTRSGTSTRAVFAGYGVNAEASYVMHGGFAPAVRVSSIVPDAAIYGASGVQRKTETAVELARFMSGHHLKWQVEFGHDDSRDPATMVRTGLYYSKLSVLAGL